MLQSFLKTHSIPDSATAVDSKGSFNRYVKLGGGRGGSGFCYEALWEGSQVIPLCNADKKFHMTPLSAPAAFST